MFAKNIVSRMQRRSIIPITNKGIKSYDIIAHVMRALNGILSTFRIHTNKTHKICLWANLQYNHIYIFIDGPIMTASKSSILNVKYNSTCSSTFQLLLQIFTMTIENCVRSFHLSYDTFNANFETVKFHDRRDTWKATLPGLLFFNTSNFHIIQFQSPRQIQLNLTLLFVNYEGIETSDCTYGGLSIFDQNIQILDICSNYGKHRPSRNIYSTYSKVTLVMYNYFPHSNISTTIYVSTTKCEAIRIHLCEYQRLPGFNDYQCRLGKISPKSNINVEISHYKGAYILATVQAGKCGILQLSTDFIDTFCPQDENHYRMLCHFFLYVKLKMYSDVLATGYSEEMKVKSKIILKGHNFVDFTAISKNLFCFDFGSDNNTQLDNKIHSGTRSCLIKGSDTHNSIFHIDTLTSTIEITTLTFTPGKRNFDLVMGSQKSKSNLIPIQQLERNGRFNTFHKYIDSVLSIRLADETDCEHFRNKHAVVYVKFIHNFFVDMFVWIWQFRAHLSCLEPVFYAFISREVSDSYYSILKESKSNVSLEAFWINSVPSRLQHDKCLSIYWKSFPNASAKIYNCTRNMILMEVFFQMECSIDPGNQYQNCV